MSNVALDLRKANQTLAGLLVDPSLDTKVTDLLKAFSGEIARLQGVIERDRTKAAEIVSEARAALKRHWWLSEGRGSYEYDDDRWKDEFKEVMTAVSNALDPMRMLTLDWTDCPHAAGEVIEARIDWKARALELEAKLAKLSA